MSDLLKSIVCPKCKYIASNGNFLTCGHLYCDTCLINPQTVLNADSLDLPSLSVYFFEYLLKWFVYEWQILLVQIFELVFKIIEVRLKLKGLFEILSN